ncbi:MAG TPA: ABC transporter permease [Vicinamibacteria bacterium]|jgi:ABC-2 type transport system permease protein|nr:ABC transporter permease [Vicinamibacteria bacterium]
MSWLAALRRAVLGPRIRALMVKEFNQIRRDRRLVTSLVVPPLVQLTLFGYALSATVSDLRLAVVDESRTPESRELIAALTESRSFRLGGYYPSARDLDDVISQGRADVGVVIPYDFARDLRRGRGATVQVLLNAMNANTATIGQGYAEGVIQSYNQMLRQAGVAGGEPAASSDTRRPGRIRLVPTYLYNPGLVDSWFIATGVFGLLVILNSSLIASAAMVKEREAGTVEQLLMSPASTAEIIVAKLAPLFVLLCMMMLLAIAVLAIVFRVPFHGSLPLVLFGGVLCVLSGMSIGTVIATFSRSAQQSQLTAFFVNPPLASLSGALNPVEAMPEWLQPLTVLNPIHHFATIMRSAMLKGSGLATLWPNALALAIFTLALVSLSVWRFRKQLS